jgi:mevalonate pyrophosphate decarboxylase
MKQKTVAIAFPTIPIIFLGGITPKRKPLYDTMGLAVTSLDETTRTETSIEIKSPNSKEPKIDFYLNNEKISGLRGSQILSSIKSFMELSRVNASIKIQSHNYQIFSGSSDSGLAAVFTALNDLFELNYTNDELLEHSMKGSESAGRSLYGGLTHTIIENETIKVEQLASDQKLKNLALFSVPFQYDSRISADEIHKGIITNPEFDKRVAKIPEWVQRIKSALKNDDLISLLDTAEENIRNAHELLEGINLHVRKPEMLRLCNDIQRMRENNLPAYFLIGGGNLISVATTNQHSKQVAKELADLRWTFYPFKVASEPKILKL